MGVRGKVEEEKTSRSGATKTARGSANIGKEENLAERNAMLKVSETNTTRDTITLEKALDDAAIEMNITEQHSGPSDSQQASEEPEVLESEQREKYSKIRLIITQDDSSCMSCPECARRSKVDTGVDSEADSEPGVKQEMAEDRVQASVSGFTQCPVPCLYDPTFPCVPQPLDTCDPSTRHELTEDVRLEADVHEHTGETLRSGRGRTDVSSGPSPESLQPQPLDPETDGSSERRDEGSVDRSKDITSSNRHRPRIVITQGDQTCGERLDVGASTADGLQSIPRLKDPEPPENDKRDTKNQDTVRAAVKGSVADVGYSEAYRNVEFLPYNPLPEQLEEVIFPDRSRPLAPFDDPFWPSKGECVDLVTSLRNVESNAALTGTFLTPAARGAE